jgi:ABC-type uncharacterized transport system permease subunit
MIIKTTVQKIATDIYGKDILHQFYLWQTTIVIVVGGALFPLTLKKKIQTLKIYSLIGVTGIILFVIMLIVACKQQEFHPL